MTIHHDQCHHDQWAPAAQTYPQVSDLKTRPIGTIVNVSGVMATAYIDRACLAAYRTHPDLSLATTAEIGSLLKVRHGSTWVLSAIRSLKCDIDRPEYLIAQLEFMGEGDEERLTCSIVNFRRGVTRYPNPTDEIYAVDTDDMRQIYGKDCGDHIEIGMVYPSRDVRANVMIDAMLGKHFALLGSTGTGKSTSNALLLHRICDYAPQGHIVMIDPHGEYGAAFRENGAIFDSSNLAMPYWLMNFEEHCEVILTGSLDERELDESILAKCLLAARNKSRMAEGMARVTVDTPIPYLLSDFLNILTNEMGRLDKTSNSTPYIRMRTRVEELRADPRYNFMFSGMLVSDTMVSFLTRILRLPTEGRPISIIDVSGVPSEVTAVVVATLSRLVFDYAIWSRGEVQRPILLVCEEAHRYVPAERDAHNSAVGKILGRIAKEGRKYGVSLGLITQRPSDLAEGILSQCGTIFAMRLNNERDQDFVRAAMPEGARGMLESISALRNRECLVCGEGVSIPMRVRLDDLVEERRPNSADVSFSHLWQGSSDEETRLERIVNRWRNQSR